MVNRIFNGLTAFGFLILILLPLFFFSSAQWSDPLEKRTSASIPEIPKKLTDVSKFIVRFESFFNDHFGFRQALIQFRIEADFWIFNRSATPLVLIGKNNWLFFSGDQSIPDYMGEMVLNDKDLESWYWALKQRRDWLKARGIDYHFVIAPNKQTVYPEHMPSSVIQGGPTVKEQLLAYLAKRGEPFLLEDLYPTLARAKGNLVLYHPLDTHWNAYGGYLGYNALGHSLMGNDRNEIHLLDLTDDEFGAENTSFGDLASMMKFERYPYSTTTADYTGPSLTCGQQVEVIPVSVTTPRASDDAVECDKVNANARAMMFNDSMIGAMKNYLGESFSHIRFARMTPSFTDIETYVRTEHPKVVVEERMERIMHNAPSRPPLAKGILSEAQPPKARAGVIAFAKADSDIVVSGFAMWQPDHEGTVLKINTNLPVEDLSLEAIDAPDVVTVLKNPRLGRSRFTLRLYLRQDKPMPEVPRLCIWSEDVDFGAVRPFVEAHADWDSCVSQ